MMMLSILKYLCILSMLHSKLASAGNLVIQPAIVDGKVYGDLGRLYVFTCTAAGSDEDKPKSLQWKFNGDVIPEDYDKHVYTRIEGDSIMLYFQRTTQEEHGVYTCSGIENGETKEIGFEFTLRQPIEFRDTPIKQSIRAGRDDDLIVCHAIATPGPQISWIRKKLSLKNDEKYQITNDGLRIKNPTAEDEGVYTCQAMVRSTAELVNRDIEVQVITPPRWVAPGPQDTKAVRGQDAIIRCDATAKPVPTISFLKDGIQVAGERFIIKDSQMTIRRVESSDSATYTCVASNEAGNIEANFKLTVLVGPVIRQFESITVDENRDISFRCNIIEAVPPPTFRWKYGDTQEFIDNVDGHISIVNTEMQSELQIRNVKKNDKRNYTCVATNEASTSEYSAGLYVRYSPVLRLTNEARKQYFSWLIVDQGGNSRGAAVVLTCIADAYPQASIKWYYRSQLITESAKYNLLRNENGYSELRVTPNDETDFGVYVCEADNIMGKTQRDVTLDRATPPTYQPAIEFGDIKPDRIQVTIRSPKNIDMTNMGLPVLSYKLQWRLSTLDWSKPNEIQPTVEPTAIDKDIIGYEIENLRPETDYVFRVAAVNEPGAGKWSNDYGVKTKPRRQPDAVKMLNKEDCGYVTRCVIEWSAEGNGGSTILDYKIKYRKILYTDSTQQAKTFGPYLEINPIGAGFTRYEISGLESNTFYEVEIFARNELGESVGQPYRVKTMQGALGSEYADPKRISNLNIGLIIGGAAVAFLILLFTIDLCCYFTNKCGIMMNIRNSCRKTKSGTKPIYKDAKYEGVPQDA